MEANLKRLSRLLKLANTRDKMVKVTQYTIRVYVYSMLRCRPSSKRKRLERLLATASFLSKVRRVLWLGRWLDSCFELRDLLAEGVSKDNLFDMTLTVLDLVNDVCDDCCTTETIRLLPPKTVPAWVELASDRAWFFATLLNLAASFAALRRDQKRLALALERKDDEAVAAHRWGLVIRMVSVLKFASDIVPSADGAWDLDVPKLYIAIFSLMSGVLSSFKIWATAA
mmetsp:Transcript_1500/g.4466  ORF Transcript_1500/g.4466 Transcript_1500/m.4466 type:complete len:227 (-) Transcript_1500:291-971(-)|eukprot:CAMPEP_0196789870 /NCGR_PEP_ID=MMETSP1104-20130614/27297_1 /TAXON_ID=33652 /ORGANISM="Cafeteria sp., Strain Caron Lab Isolate" /LENGTH=226 /DNA_ID=CAMNT_0042160233 /DNA_START=61 /DNA_END=741 /DNA_ORIENTATION=-